MKNSNKIISLLLLAIFILLLISIKYGKNLAEPLSKVVLSYDVSKSYSTSSWQRQITTANFIIFYNVTGSNGVTDSYANQVGNGLENAWNVFIVNYGFKKPQSADGGRIEVMIKKLGGSYAGVTHCVKIGNQWKVDYIEIDHDLSGKDQIYDITGHEFFHCVQAAHNAVDESNWIVEGMAVAAGDRVYDPANICILG